ncbi:MAG: oligosaccharide flippase family protein [bacterium]|nr:oligosaccharide flippase family protein [bacterium]
MSVRATLARNTKWNAVGRFWEAAASLVLMRYVAGVFDGNFAPLGLWMILGVATGYVALLDLGVGSSFTKYVAEHAARNESDKLSAVVTTGLVFYLLFGAVIVAAGWPVVNLVAAFGDSRGWFKGVPLVDVRFLFHWGLVLYAATGCVAAFRSVIAGLQRMDLGNLLSFGVSLVKIAATILFLEWGHGVRGLLYASAASTVAFGLGSIVLAHRLIPGLRVTPAHVDRHTFRRMFGYGWRTQVARFANLVMLETDRVLVGLFVGLHWVPPYEFGLTIANKLRQVPSMLLSALLPAASDLDAREEHERLQRLYLLASKYVASVAIPSIVFAMGAAGLIMRAWLGDKPGLDTAAWVLRIIALAYVANIMPGAGVAVVLGKGRADLQMKAGLICTVGNILLTIALYFLIGFWGIPIATALSMFIGWMWFNVAVRGVLGVGALRFLRVTLLWPAVASLPGLAVAVAADVLTTGIFGFGVAGPALLACAALFGLLYAVLIRFTPFFDAFDIDFLEEALYLDRVPGFRLWARRIRHA